LGKRLGQPKPDGDWVVKKGFALSAFKCFGISHLSVSKMEVLEVSTEGKHFVITFTLTINNKTIPTAALSECGPSGIAFMDQDFAHHHQIPLQKLQQK
jgi:hypothetical protein